MAETDRFNPETRFAQGFLPLALGAADAAEKVDGDRPVDVGVIGRLLKYFDALLNTSNPIGIGAAAELNAIIEMVFKPGIAKTGTPLLQLLTDHSVMYAQSFAHYESTRQFDPSCYRAWLTTRTGAFADFSNYACLASDAEIVMNLAGHLALSAAVREKLFALRQLILQRMAEVLVESNWEPDSLLSEVDAVRGPTPAQFLALQVFRLTCPLKEQETKIPAACKSVNDTLENTLLYWSSLDPFYAYLFVAWKWLAPFSYDAGALHALAAEAAGAKKTVPADDRAIENRGDTDLTGHQAALAKRCGSLYEKWIPDGRHPSELARRVITDKNASALELSPSRGDDTPPAEKSKKPDRFPCLLTSDEQYGFAPVPMLLIGGAEVGKTSFLCAVAHHLMKDEQLSSGMTMRVHELQRHYESHYESWTRSLTQSTGETSNYKLLVECSDNDVNHSMALRLTDYKGEDIANTNFKPDFVKALKEARGLIFLVDDKFFPNFSGDGQLDANSKRQARELASTYATILTRFLQLNEKMVHFPIALVVTKADKLFGAEQFKELNPPSLIPASARMEFIQGGLSRPGEPATAYDRLCHAIKYDLTNSKVIRVQRFVVHFLDCFKLFINEALKRTYRFQIFFASSLYAPEAFPKGSWESADWVVSHLANAFRVQAGAQLNDDCAMLEKIGKDAERFSIQTYLAEKAVYDEAAGTLERFQTQGRTFYEKATAPSDETLTKQKAVAADKMKAALNDIFKDLKADPIDEKDFAPFNQSYRRALEMLDELKAQRQPLETWRDALQKK